MPLTDENKGTNADGSRREDYCIYCYKAGAFTQNFTMSQMVEYCLQFLEQMNAQSGLNLTPVQAKEQMFQSFPRLKRWEEKDKRTLQMSKIGAKGFHEVWMATSAGSMKVNDFKQNNKAGLCYDYYGDGVALRGTVEIVTDEVLLREMWQDWFIHHFPGGPTDPDYVLLHFIGMEATFWINGEFSHSVF